MMILDMRALVGVPTLAGAAGGKRALAKLLEATIEPADPMPCLIDFTEIEIATASFLRESVLTFREIIRSKGSTLYPVVANANGDIIDDLRAIVDAVGRPVMSCKIDKNKQIIENVLIGELDPKQRITFDLVNIAGETDAGTLMRDNGKDEAVGQTAWNNRLSSLASLGLIVEIPRGRVKRYRALFSEA